MRRVAGGRQSFAFLREGDYFYVDRTAFIAQWYRSGDEVTLITRPRRFGKTLTLDMMNCFFSTEYKNRKDLFENLNISQDAEMMEMQGTKPVIILSFANHKPADYALFLEMVLSITAKLYIKHRYLLEGDVLEEAEKRKFRMLLDDLTEIPSQKTQEGRISPAFSRWLRLYINAVADLSTWMERYYGQKVMIFLDEYDTPLQAAYMYGYWDDASWFMREFFGMSFKNNPSLDRALITGITRIAKESLFSDLNHLIVASTLSDRYSKVFGFSQDEVDKILNEYGISELKDDVRSWYDGFSFGRQRNIYNPWSICCLLSEPGHPLRSYWAQSGGLSMVDHLLRGGSSELHEQFQSLLLGEQIVCAISEELVFPSLQTSDSTIWSLLLSAGYIRPVLSPESFSEDGLDYNAQGPLTLTVTNQEMLKAFSDLAHDWFWKDHVNYLDCFLKALFEEKTEDMQEALSEIVLICASSFDLGRKPSRENAKNQPEKYFQGLMTGLVAGVLERFRVSSNGESGHGRYDLTLEPKSERDDAHQMEFKVFDERVDHDLRDTAKRALKQMKDRKYDTALRAAGIERSRIHQYGIGFRGKEVMVLAGET